MDKRKMNYLQNFAGSKAFRELIKKQFSNGLPAKRSKYFNKITEVDGIKFDSAREAQYYCQDKLKIKAGILKKVDRQVPFVVKIKGIKCFAYIADFVEYYPDGSYDVIDVKGFKTDIYKLKKRIVEAYFGIKIIEK